MHGYCSVDNLVSFTMDPPSKAKQRVCLLLITACSKEAFTVYNVTHFAEGAVTDMAFTPSVDIYACCLLARAQP